MKQSPPIFTFYLNFECDGCLGKATSYKNTNHSYVSDAVVKRQYIIKGSGFHNVVCEILDAWFFSGWRLSDFVTPHLNSTKFSDSPIAGFYS